MIYNIIISDTHIDNKISRLDKIGEMMQYIKEEHKDKIISKLIINGDFLDSWTADTWNITDIFNAISIGQHETIIIEGNHDPERLNSWVPSGVSVERSYPIGTTKGTYLVLHGHQYDVNVSEFSWFWRWIYKIKEYLYNKFDIDIQKILKFSLSNRWKSMYFKKVVWKSIEMMKNLYENDHIGVVCGHTHYPIRLTLGGFEYLNSGDCIDNYTYVRISNDGKADLCRYFPKEKL